MTRTRTLLAAGLILALPLGMAACGDSNQPPLQPSTSGQTSTSDIDMKGAKVFTAADSTIEATAGGAFAIRLKSNPSTGYTWRLTGNTGTAGLTLVRSEYTPAPGSEGRAGAGGEDTFYFTSATAGSGRLTLELFPPGSKKAAQTQIFTVKTAPAG